MAPRGRKRERQIRRARAEQHESARAAYLAAILKADAFAASMVARPYLPRRFARRRAFKCRQNIRL